MATPSESERGGPDASRLPLEIDFTEWDDVVFRNLQPSDVKYFNDETLTRLARYLNKLVLADEELGRSLNVRVVAHFSEASIAAKDRKIAALDEIWQGLRTRYEAVIRASRERTLQERLENLDAELLAVDERRKEGKREKKLLKSRIERIYEDESMSREEKSSALAPLEDELEVIKTKLEAIEAEHDSIMARMSRSQQASTGSAQSEPAVSVNALEGMMRSRKLPWTIPLGRPMFNAITGVPGQDTSGVHSWGVQLLELAKWGNFEDYDLSQTIGQDATFDAAAFLPGAAFDRSQSETGCAMQMFARSGDPLLKHVFGDLQAFSSLHMDIKFESYTVVGSRTDELWVGTGLPHGEEGNATQKPIFVHEHKKPAVFPAPKSLDAGEETKDNENEDGPKRLRIWEYGLGQSATRGSERIAAARNRGIGFARALATAVDVGLSNAGASLRSTSGNNSREYVHNGTKDALERIYGYMIALGLRYGALSTTEYTWFLKREEWQGSDENRKPITPRLLVSKAYSCTGEGTKSVHMGYLIALCRALEDHEARNQFPQKDSQLGQHVISEWRNGLRGNNGTQIQRRNPYDDAAYEYFKGVRDTEPGAPGDDVLLPLPRNAMADLLPVPWDKAYESVRESSTSSVKRLRRPDGLAFMVKTLVTGGRMGGLSVDEARSTVEYESSVYTALRSLQGIAVPPLVYGGTLMDECNWFAVITLDVGTSLQEVGPPFAAEVREGALAALARVHAAGWLHGDVALRNFVLCPETGAVRVIDFARARLVKPESAEAKQGAEAEMRELRACLGAGIA